MKLSNRDLVPGWECRCDACMTAITHGAPIESPDDGPQIGLKDIWGEDHHLPNDDNQRYDVIYSSFKECYLEPHFCREWDESGGCYGFNSRHGFSKAEGLEQQIEYYSTVISVLKTQLYKLKAGEKDADS